MLGVCVQKQPPTARDLTTVPVTADGNVCMKIGVGLLSGKGRLLGSARKSKRKNRERCKIEMRRQRWGEMRHQKKVTDTQDFSQVISQKGLTYPRDLLSTLRQQGRWV